MFIPSTIQKNSPDNTGWDRSSFQVLILRLIPSSCTFPSSQEYLPLLFCQTVHRHSAVVQSFLKTAIHMNPSSCEGITPPCYSRNTKKRRCLKKTSPVLLHVKRNVRSHLMFNSLSNISAPKCWTRTWIFDFLLEFLTLKSRT